MPKTLKKWRRTKIKEIRNDESTLKRMAEHGMTTHFPTHYKGRKGEKLARQHAERLRNKGWVAAAVKTSRGWDIVGRNVLADKAIPGGPWFVEYRRGGERVRTNLGWPTKEDAETWAKGYAQYQNAAVIYDTSELAKEP